MLSPGKEVTNKNFTEWRKFLKQELLHKRHYRSDFSGKLITLSTGCHLHEGIVTRACVPKSIWWHPLIFDERNVLLLLPTEHIPQPPPQEWCILKLYSLYGRDEVRKWFYEELPWKSVPFQLP